jgi:hypothetical protein
LLLEIICYLISPSVLWSSFGSYSFGVPVVILTSFISSILLRCLHHFILYASVYLTISSPFINVCSSLLLLILYRSLH